MSRYADRRNPVPSSSNRGDTRERAYTRERQPVYQGYTGHSNKNIHASRDQITGYGGGDNDDDDETVVETQVSTVVSTAVGTDLSLIKPPTRSRAVSFGANEVEEFNGSEAPEAIEPARSRMENRTPVPQPNASTLVRAVPLGRPSSRGGTPVPSLSRSTPPIRHLSPRPQQAFPSQDRYNLSQRESRSNEYLHDYRTNDQHGGADIEPDDFHDDDAFTAIADSTVAADSIAGTGVATDLSLDEIAPRRAAAGDYAQPAFPMTRSSQGPPQVQRVGHYLPSESASGFSSSYFEQPDERDMPRFGAERSLHGRQSELAPPPAIRRLRSTDGSRDLPKGMSSASGEPSGRSTPTLPGAPQAFRVQDSPIEKELIGLLKELQFSLALKDFHEAFQIGVQRTLVTEDGLGHAYCKVHCKKLPRHEDIAKQTHLRKHWIPIAGSRWEFRTASHSVTVVFKTAALAAYEAQSTTLSR
ncbi:uncharacterized protein JCM15063_003459 [Sporobolomyces koalae]|uniref:uncharacterized protein n=1 Tax=Sporobolomyces koalae TaxID=500713 RepID=UPI00316C53CC